MEILAQLLIVLALILGWLVGRYGPGGKKRSETVHDASVHIPAGVRFTFENYSDEAIDKYVQSLDISRKTIPMHLSIASHFRKKGEVERAILIHQNIIANPLLDADSRERVTYELARDFLSAGLLDRAEALARQLEKSRLWGARSLRLLLDIYQDEKEWVEAKAVALKLDYRRDPVVQKRIAHYCCEQAYLSQRNGDWHETRSFLKEALSFDRSCVRVSFMSAQLHERFGEYQEAVKSLMRIKDQDARFLPEIVEALVGCHRKLGQEVKLQQDLVVVLENTESARAIIAYADSLRVTEGGMRALTFLEQRLVATPSAKVLEHYLALQLEVSPADEHDKLHVIRQVIPGLLRGKPLYLCESCGYSGRTLLWLCPSCKQWETIKPVKGVEGI